MKRMFLATAVLAALCAALYTALPALAQGEVEEKIDKIMAGYDEAESTQAKLDIIRDALSSYPESKYTATLLSMAKEHYMELGQMDEFVSLAMKVRSQVKSVDAQRDIDGVLVETYGEMKDTPRLDEAAERYIGESEENFNLFYDLIQAYANANGWSAVLKYAGRAEQFANAEAYRKDNPTRKMSDEDLAQRGRNRQGILLAYAGWAKANTGRPDEAFADYEKADALMPRAYMGFSTGDLDYFWGVTLERSGKLDAALSRLAPLALFGGDEKAGESMKEAYIKKNGSDAGYDAFLKDERMKYSRPIDDFTLAQYDSTMLSLSSFKGKVMVVSFWFPT
jgi:tetratricopeptide (TPR) repeat protein